MNLKNFEEPEWFRGRTEVMSGTPNQGAITGKSQWGEIIPDTEWSVYQRAIQLFRDLKVPFVLGGAFGLAGYTGRWRNTKDMDFFLRPSDKDKVVDALTKEGFEDYYTRLPYDRGWIYRAVDDDVIVDLIWGTPNRVTEVDDLWFEFATPISIRGEAMHVLPAEELLYIKLFVLQRDRCDWPDLLNLLYAVGPRLRWDHVMRRLGPDKGLMGGLLQLFTWLAPEIARKLPMEIQEQFHLQPKEGVRDLQGNVNVLDSRPWFSAFQPVDQAMRL
ncbi:MAG: nucleotidyltransferase family protein [Verrucomicrobiota bacterium]|nr:nucleotidyltransferase family protein [Verrucomicrobiota bacterium]